MMGTAIHPVRLVAAPELPDPPYPKDTKSKGWRFDIDVERLEQSDTWALAEPEVRPWLLMLWVVAWKQIPCGSYPADDRLIAARIGMRPALFAAQRETLLRGWWHANDGRIYHNVIAEQVLALVNWRANEAERKAKQRAKLEAERQEKQRLSSECPTGHERDSHGTPTGVRTPSPSPSPSPSTTSLRDVVESAAVAPPPATQEQAPEPKKRGRKPAGAKPSRRCPADYIVTEEMALWAQVETPLVNVMRQLAEFRDYEFKSPISDWDAAFRNWLRRAQRWEEERRQPASGQRQQERPKSDFQDRSDYWAEVTARGIAAAKRFEEDPSELIAYQAAVDKARGR